MSPSGPGRRLRDAIDDNPLQGGLTGIALVALATLALAVVGMVICVAVLTLVG